MDGDSFGLNSHAGARGNGDGCTATLELAQKIRPFPMGNGIAGRPGVGYTGIIQRKQSIVARRNTVDDEAAGPVSESCRKSCEASAPIRGRRQNERGTPIEITEGETKTVSLPSIVD